MEMESRLLNVLSHANTRRLKSTEANINNDGER
jgi:hypothetical protein